MDPIESEMSPGGRATMELMRTAALLRLVYFDNQQQAPEESEQQFLERLAGMIHADVSRVLSMLQT